MSNPETVDDYYARIRAAAAPDGRLPVAVEQMPGWDIFPYEIDSLRLKPVLPPADGEPARRGEDPAHCWCAQGVDAAISAGTVWTNDRWKLDAPDEGSGLPLMAWLSPLVHCDLATMPDDVARDLGPLIGTISAAIESLPSVGRCHVGRYGDGGAHLHLFFMGRPARILQFRGSPLLDWEENLPRVPEAVHAANLRPVAQALVTAYGGRLGPFVS